MKISSFLTSSIGRKVTMSLTGLFLILFLLVHLIGNLQLLKANGDAFNHYAHFMGSNPVIKIISIVNFLIFFLHILSGAMLYLKNSAARGSQPYAVSTKDTKSTWASRNMTLLGVILFIFLIVHLAGFWFKAKFGSIPMDSTGIPDLHTVAVMAFHEWYIVLVYVVSMAVLGFHLWHGFPSAFQTLGLNHKRYTPVIISIGRAYAWIVSIGYALIPIIVFFKN